MRGRRPLLHNVIPSWWSPPTFNPLLRQLERAPAFPALRAVSKDTWCQCLLKPQLKFIFRDHLCIQAEGIPGTVGSLRHPICSNHVHHKSWTMSVRLTLHSLAGSPLRHIKYFALSANKSSWYFHLKWKMHIAQIQRTKKPKYLGTFSIGVLNLNSFQRCLVQ